MEGESSWLADWLLRCACGYVGGVGGVGGRRETRCMWAIEWTFGRSRPFKKFPSCCFPWPPNPFPPRRHTFHQPHTHPTPPHRVPQAAGTSKRSRQCVHKCQGGRKRREYLGPFNTPTLNQGHANVHHQKHHDNDKKKGSLHAPPCGHRPARRVPRADGPGVPPPSLPALLGGRGAETERGQCAAPGRQARGAPGRRGRQWWGKQWQWRRLWQQPWARWAEGQGRRGRGLQGPGEAPGQPQPQVEQHFGGMWLCRPRLKKQGRGGVSLFAGGEGLGFRCLTRLVYAHYTPTHTAHLVGRGAV